MSQWFASSINTSLISLLHVEIGAQFFNATSVPSSAVTVIYSVTKINTTE